MRVLLVYPPFDRLQGFKVNTFPINLGQLATCLEESGHYTRIYNADSSPLKSNSHKQYSEKNRATSHEDYIKAFSEDDHPVWKEVQKVILDFNPDIVGISSMTATLPTALKVARITKTVNRNLPIVMGGCHPTVMPIDVIRRDDVDFVIQGEGEISLVQLCDCLDNQNKKILDDIKGLYYKQNGNIINPKPNEFISDLNSLPMIKRDLILFPENYNPDSFSKLMASRGCPYSCTFCSSPAIWKRKVRYREPEKIIEEMNYLMKEFNVFHFSFWDDTFTANRKYTKNICRLLIENNTKFAFTCLVRANTVDKETLQYLKNAGCRKLSLGIESGSDRVLKLMKKGITVDMVRKAVGLIKKEGFYLNSFWMMGMPYETETDMLKTIKLMRELDLDLMNFCTFVPEPMTKLYDLCVEEGLLERNIDWGVMLGITHHSTKNFFNKNVSRARYKEIYQEALKVVEFTNKRTITRKLRYFWLLRNYYLKPRVIKQRIMDYYNNQLTQKAKC